MNYKILKMGSFFININVNPASKNKLKEIATNVIYIILGIFCSDYTLCDDCFKK